MSLRVTASYKFDVIGDDTTKAMIIPLRGLKATDPIVDSAIPTGLRDATATNGLTVIASIVGDNGDMMQLDFSAAPPANRTTSVTVNAIFGTDRI